MGDVNGIDYGDASTTPRFGIGLCSSAGSVFRRATAGHWIGNITTGTSWAINNEGSGSFRSNFVTMAPAKKVGSTLTVGTNFSSVANLGTGAEPTPANLFQAMIFIDITKGSPNYSFRLFGINNPCNGGGNSRAQWETQMVLETPTQANYFYAAAQTVAVNEATDGTLDSINIFNELPIEIEIWDHGLVRFS